MLVKVCGITNVGDGIMASEMGAFILGVVLSERSIRKGTVEVVSQLKSYGYSVAAVHTSMNDAITSVGDEDYIQLHFPHVIHEVEEIKKLGKKVISVIPVDSSTEYIGEIKQASDLVLFEHKPEIVDKMTQISPFMDKSTGVAGGIAINNLREIISHEPGFIDVSSSLECAPGKKSKLKMEKFFREVKLLGNTCEQDA